MHSIRETFRFVLGFSSYSLQPAFVALQCAKFIKDAFMVVRVKSRVNNQIKTEIQWAMINSFQSPDLIHNHTGIVLLERIGEYVSALEYRRGVPNVAPWGASFPRCPQCKISNMVSADSKGETLRFTCRCGLKTGHIHRPADVLKISSRLHGQGHFIFPFPHPCYTRLRLEWFEEDYSRVVSWWGMINKA